MDRDILPTSKFISFKRRAHARTVRITGTGCSNSLRVMVGLTVILAVLGRCNMIFEKLAGGGDDDTSSHLKAKSRIE